MTRKSRRELEQAVDRLTKTGEFPSAGFIRLLPATVNGDGFEVIDAECNIVQVESNLHRVPRNSMATLTGEQ